MIINIIKVVALINIVKEHLVIIYISILLLVSKKNNISQSFSLPFTLIFYNLDINIPETASSLLQVSHGFYLALLL
jgi:hypothetical protein